MNDTSIFSFSSKRPDGDRMLLYSVPSGGPVPPYYESFTTRQVSMDALDHLLFTNSPALGPKLHED